MNRLHPEIRDMGRYSTLVGSRLAIALASALPFGVACEPAPELAFVSPEPEPGRPVFEARVRPDPESGTLDAEWRIGFVVDPEATDPVSFLLARDLEIRILSGEGVLGYREEPSAFVPVWREVVLELDPARVGGPVTLDLTYAGTPALPPNRINQISPDWVELSVDSGWHPLFTTLDQEMRGVAELFLPEDWTLVGGVPSYDEGRWVVRFDEPQIDVSFVAVPGLEKAPGERVHVMHRDGAPETVRAVLEVGEACAAYLDERYGSEAPLPHTALILADRPSNAYARIGHIVLGSVDPSDGPGLGRFLCHELSHYWSRGADFSTVHHWMSEAFAEFLGARFVRERYGREAFGDLIGTWQRASRDEGPVWTEETVDRGSDVLMYRKAPVLLARLEERIGEETFDRFLERYMIRSVATTEELLEHLGEVAGTGASTWFRELLAAGPGS